MISPVRLALTAATTWNGELEREWGGGEGGADSSLLGCLVWLPSPLHPSRLLGCLCHLTDSESAVTKAQRFSYHTAVQLTVGKADGTELSSYSE